MPIRNFKKEPGYDYRMINNVVDIYTNKQTDKTLNRINQLKKDGFSVVNQPTKTGINQDMIVLRKPNKDFKKPFENKESVVAEKKIITKKDDKK